MGWRRASSWLVLACALGCGDPAPDDVDDSDPVDDTDPDVDDTDVPPPVCPPELLHTVATTSGCVVGTAEGRGEAFLGVPYAEPPVGPRRWLRPEPHAPWASPLQATAVGPACPQSSGTISGSLAPGDGEEDCLTLNVWRPEGAADLPILFFVHGGGHTDGSGGEPVYADDPALAEGAVVVTHNYRLGPLGFLAHEDLSSRDGQSVSGNFGLRDTLLALRWVRDNAEALGGDPDRILVFGESAGGLSTCALWLAPEADGLFAAALTQSAPCSGIQRQLAGADESLETGHEQGARFAAALGCDEVEDVPACLRGKSVEEVLAALPARQGLLDAGEAWGPVVDGALLPLTWDSALGAGVHADVPLHAGFNEDEGRLFTSELPIPTEGAYRLALLPFALVYGTTAGALMDIWPVDDFGGDPKAAFTTFYGDVIFACPTRRMVQALRAGGGTSLGYVFGRAPLGVELIGPTHGVELPYVFGTLGPLAPPADVDLSASVRAAWSALPGGAPTWPGVGAWPDDAWLVVDATGAVGAVDDVRATRCDAFDALTAP